MTKERIIKFAAKLDDATAQANSLEFIKELNLRSGTHLFIYRITNPAVSSIQIEEVDDLATYLDTLSLMGGRRRKTSKRRRNKRRRTNKRR
jgi:hypothetical protein